MDERNKDINVTLINYLLLFNTIIIQHRNNKTAFAFTFTFVYTLYIMHLMIDQKKRKITEKKNYCADRFREIFETPVSSSN